MALDKIITVEKLGKKYSLRHQGDGRYTALRDVLTDKAKSLFQRRRLTSDLRHPTSARAAHEDFWALKDVNFDVTRGEVLGIIGRNGAGKSTLLKILSRITEPTEGKIRIKGRVASLLEVGTGFHPELTGRENVYLNGAILGMTRAEIKAKFDEIVAFAEVEKFLDTPVKRYSSGMYVRLAFAVAAHLEPEVLVIDEVLAVGDFNFQRKCLGKMQEISSKDGRAVLFVSHNMNAVTSLCSKCILLQNGRMGAMGEVDETVGAYLRANSVREGMSLRCEQAMPQAKKAFIECIELSAENNQTGTFDFREQLRLRIQYRVLTRLDGAHCTIEVCSNNEVIFVSFDTDKSSELLGKREIGIYNATVQLPKELLKPGMYFINVGLGVPQGEIIDRMEHAIRFEINLRGEYAAFISYASHRRGVVALNTQWETRRIDF